MVTADVIASPTVSPHSRLLHHHRQVQGLSRGPRRGQHGRHWHNAERHRSPAALHRGRRVRLLPPDRRYLRDGPVLQHHVRDLVRSRTTTGTAAAGSRPRWVAGTNWFTTAGGRPAGTQYNSAAVGPQRHPQPLHRQHVPGLHLLPRGPRCEHDGAPGTYILKNDPAKGVIAAVGSGYADAAPGGMGYGSKYGPTTTQAAVL